MSRRRLRPLRMSTGGSSIEGLSLSQSEAVVPAWTLRSRLALLREEQNSATLEAPAMEFYRDGLRRLPRDGPGPGRSPP